MLKKIYGSAVFGVEAHTITIEVNVDKGIGYHLVGLPDNAIKESNFRIAAARELQTKRFIDSEVVHYNAQMNVKQIRKHCKLDSASMQLLKTAMERLNLSARAYDRILKVARTIADLEGTLSIESAHISEAIQYRSLDREGWLG